MAQVALSTMWGLGRFPKLDEFFRNATEVGFRRFELNHGVTPALLSGLNLNGYRISSIHEPCPAEPSVGALKVRNWLVSATNEENRRAGVGAIQRSIDLAVQLETPVVIVHPGRVDVDPEPEAALYRMYRAGQAGTAEYKKLAKQLGEQRAAKAPANLAAVAKSLGELAEYAEARGIRLGLENRFHFHEIPLPDELEVLLKVGPSGVIGYWHDVGHAQVLENLGFGTHEEWLRRFAPRIVGVHLHDVVGINDHQAAGRGQMDWDMVARYLPASALRTCEFQNDQSAQQVAAGVEWLVKKGCVQA